MLKLLRIFSILLFIYKSVISKKINLKSNQIKENEWNSIAYNGFKINQNEILKKSKLKLSDNDPFPHTINLLEALKNGKTKFEIQENVNTINKNSDNLMSESMYGTTTSYRLKDQNYFILDNNDHKVNITDIFENSIEHCKSDIKVGDFYIGSHTGDWVNSNSHWTDHVTSKKGLFFTRQVDSMTSSTNGCFTIRTKDIHPFQLFDSFNVISISKLGSGIDYKTNKQIEDLNIKQDKKRELGNFYDDDSPVACTKANFEDEDDDNDEYNKQGYYTGTYEFYPKNEVQYTMYDSLTNGCVSMVNTGPDDGLPSFNFNWNGAYGATETFPIINGVTCSDCYAYIGASFMIEINYFDHGSEMFVEAKLMVIKFYFLIYNKIYIIIINHCLYRGVLVSILN